jgi:hypothetical protein
MIPFFVVSAKYVMYPVQIGTGRRVQCRVQSNGIKKRIVELSSIVEIHRLFWVIVDEVSHERFFRQCGPLPYTILPLNNHL